MVVMMRPGIVLLLLTTAMGCPSPAALARKRITMPWYCSWYISAARRYWLYRDREPPPHGGTFDTYSIFQSNDKRKGWPFPIISSFSTRHIYDCTCAHVWGLLMPIRKSWIRRKFVVGRLPKGAVFSWLWGRTVIGDRSAEWQCDLSSERDMLDQKQKSSHVTLVDCPEAAHEPFASQAVYSACFSRNGRWRLTTAATATAGMETTRTTIMISSLFSLDNEGRYELWGHRQYIANSWFSAAYCPASHWSRLP